MMSFNQTVKQILRGMPVCSLFLFTDCEIISHDKSDGRRDGEENDRNTIERRKDHAYNKYQFTTINHGRP